MSSDEKSELLGNDEVRAHGENRVVEPKLRCIHFVVLPLTILFILPYAQDFYMAQQWIQHIVQKELEISPDKVSTTGCNSVNHSSSSYLAYKTVEQRTAQWTMYNSLAMSVPSFFGAALVPAYSDSFGRRYLFLISCSSCVIKLIIHGLCIYYSWSLIWVVLGTGLDSLTGGVYTFLSALMSYAADITPPGRKRTFALTLVDGCMLLCVTLAGLISGLVIQYKGFVFLAFLDVLLCFVAWGIMVTALPETHDVRNRTEAGSIWQTCRRMLDVYISKTFKKRRVAYIILISAFFFEEMTNVHRSSIEILYQLGQPFCWSAGAIGVFSAARHATECVAGILFIAPLKTFLSDLSIAIWSTVFNAASFVLEACARTDTAMYLVPVLATFSFLTIPMIKSMISSMTPADQQGSIFASVVTVQTLCGIVASFLLNQIYASTVNFFSGFVFLVLAGICAIVFALLLIFAKTQKVYIHERSIERTVNSV